VVGATLAQHPQRPLASEAGSDDSAGISVSQSLAMQQEATSTVASTLAVPQQAEPENDFTTQQQIGITATRRRVMSWWPGL
jgi:hypothetical protein